MQCPSCHKPLPERALYCPSCGQQIDEDLSKEDPSNPSGKSSPTSYFNSSNLILSFLAVLLLWGIGFYFFHSTKNEPLFPSAVTEERDSSTERLLAPAKGFMEALQSKNPAKAYEDFASIGFKENTSLKQFQDFVYDNPFLTQFKDIQVKAHEINQGRGLVMLLLDPDKENLPVEFRLIQENGIWKVLFIRALYPQETKSSGGKLDALSIISTVQEYLEVLQNHKISQAYKKFLGKDLKSEVPLEGFRQFIENYPAFTNHDSVNIEHPYFEDKMGEIKIELQSGNEITEVTYVLQEENREWKIIGMHVEKVAHAGTDINQNVANFKTRDLINAIQNFLKTLRDQKTENAYADLTAAHFREENTYPAFEEFIKKYPQLSDSESATFEKLMFNNNIATFAVALYVNETEALPVEFDLIQENGKWKVLNLFVHPIKKIDLAAKQKAPQVESPVEFPKAEFGTKINENGQIEDPTTGFKQGKSDIYVNIFIQHGIEGTPFDVVMRHVESGSSIPTVQAKVLEDGESVVSLVFSPPPKGWPVGNYQIRISAENKVYKTFVFKVE